MSKGGAHGATAGPIVVGIGEVLWDLLPGGRQMGGAPVNVACHAHRLGARAVAVSAVGADALGDELRARLESLGVDAGSVFVVEGQPTGTVSVTVGPGGEPTYVIARPSAWDFIPETPDLLDLARRADAVCYGTLAQRGTVSRRTIRSFIDNVRSDCLRVLDLNLRGPASAPEAWAALLNRSNVVKMNQDELSRLAQALGLEGSEEALVERLAERYGLLAVAVTLGPRGCRLRIDRQVVHAGFPVAVEDTVGAGDAFTAALVVGLLRHAPVEQIAADANRVASQVCQTAGACNAGVPAR